MKYGIYIRENEEIVITSRFKAHFIQDEPYYSAFLYYDDKLICTLKRKMEEEKETKWAFLNSEGQVFSNDKKLEKMINKKYKELDLSDFELKDEIILRTANLDSYLTIDENPIRECLRDWATGSRLEITKERLYFYMQTNINQYMIVVRSDGDVYGSIKYSVFVENGVFVGNQYFRMRNYLDNRANICWWRCYLGQQYWKENYIDTTKLQTQIYLSRDGTYMLLKDVESEKITLFAGIEEECSYTRGRAFIERFEYITEEEEIEDEDEYEYEDEDI